MKKFFSSIIVLIIVVAVGYLGYTLYISNYSSMNMQANSMNNQMQPGNNPSTLQNANFALQNKESVDKIISTIDDALKTMTFDPYSPNNTNNQANNGTNTQGNTIINIYPSGMQPNNSTVPASGLAYDPAKMEQLHTGLYKISVGMQLLNQLKDEFIVQAEQAGIDIKDPIQYYSNQYTYTLQNKNKLNQVLFYLNEAANFVNINPYVSSNGIVYDKDKMQQVHGSVYKLAQGTVALNKLNDDITKQAVILYNSVQNNASLTQPNMTAMNQNMPGLFSNINTQNILNILLIIFASAFIIGILGLLLSLLKPKASQANKSNMN